MYDERPCSCQEELLLINTYQSRPSAVRIGAIRPQFENALVFQWSQQLDLA